MLDEEENSPSPSMITIGIMDVCDGVCQNVGHDV